VPGVGAYPGSFNPPTVAHLAIASAALVHAGLDRIDLIVSRWALGKDDAATRPVLDDRLAVLGAVAAGRPWLGVRVTDVQLIADMVEGYDVVIVGADKWAQINDPSWYGGGAAAARDAAVARLPRLLIAPRAGPAAGPSGAGDDAVAIAPKAGVERLEIAAEHLPVSSTAARAGRREWMAPEAAAFDVETGAWSDGRRYDAWRAARDGPANREAGTSAK
jgi:hypothetical protein